MFFFIQLKNIFKIMCVQTICNLNTLDKGLKIECVIFKSKQVNENQ